MCVAALQSVCLVSDWSCLRNGDPLIHGEEERDSSKIRGIFKQTATVTPRNPILLRRGVVLRRATIHRA